MDFNSFIKLEDLAEAVGLTDGQTEMDELKRHIDALEKNEWIKENRTMHDSGVRIVEEGVTQKKHREINL